MIKFAIVSTFFRIVLRRPTLWYGHPDAWSDKDWALYRRVGL